MAKGVECKLTDCSHNEDRRCAINSRAEPLLDWMSFSGYCPDYTGTKFTGVRDENRKGKSKFGSMRR